MEKVELLVELLIPDTTAITAFHALERMGYDKLKKVKRYDYYEFEVDSDVEQFSEKITKVDILVNANKHKASTKRELEGKGILVQEMGENAAGILSTLKTRLGFSEIASMKKGVIWDLSFEGLSAEEEKIQAMELAEKFFFNRHFQEYALLE